MTSEKNNQDDDCNEEDYTDFPIPRDFQIHDQKEPFQPGGYRETDDFNPVLFQHFFSLVNFHLPQYDLAQVDQYSAALDTIRSSFDDEFKNSPILQEHIARKFLIESHFQMLDLTLQLSLSKIAMLHNELSLVSGLMKTNKTPNSLIEYCEMLIGEVYDIFDAQIAKTVKQQFWDVGKNADNVINEFIQPQIECLRILNTESYETLASCVVTRSMHHAGTQYSKKIAEWAKHNDIII